MVWPFPGQRGGGGKPWADVLAAVVLLVLTAIVGLAYVVEPQSPADYVDLLRLAIDRDAYVANVRRGERLMGRAARAEAAGLDSTASGFLWRAARAFENAASGVEGPRAELAANDRIADAYLELGVKHLRRGRGGRFGIGRGPEDLEAAEDIAACVVGVAPTRRRAEVNAFLVELEEVLERPPEGRCPR